MKKFRFLILLGLAILFFTSSCTFKKDDLEGATIYTTVYPINYLTEYLYSDYGNISSIYPKDTDLTDYNLTDKQISNFAKGNLFIYNGLTKEKEIAKTLLNQNKNLLIIDVSYGLTLENDPAEFWLSPNNYLMLAKNIRDNLKEYIKSKIVIDTIDSKYKEFEEKISVMDASLHTLGSTSKKNNKNIIVTSNATFKYLENYGFEVICLTDKANLKDIKLNNIKNNFKSGKYKYILMPDGEKESDLVKTLTTDYNAKLMKVNMLTNTLDKDYFEIMTEYIDNLKVICS